MASKGKAKAGGPARGSVKPAKPNFTPEQVEGMKRFLQSKRPGPVAVFLGAGASKPLGYPLTGELLYEILHRLRKGGILQTSIWRNPTKRREPWRELHDFLGKLLPALNLSKEKMPLVTGVLSLLDFSLANGQALLPGQTLEHTRRMRGLLEQAVLETIPDDEWFDEVEEVKFDRVCQWLKSLCRVKSGPLGVITTNYDMIADAAALTATGVEGGYFRWSYSDMAKKVDFGFRWVDPNAKSERFYARPKSPLVELYKLHGSTNWLRCPLCENIYINNAGPIAWNASETGINDANSCHCSSARLEAQLVSPSFVRDMRAPNLVSVWKSALDFLRKAKEWIVIGYSFPDEDVGIRALFTRAFGANGHQPRITVIQLDEKALVNYESFFPKRSLTYLTGGLDLMLECLREQTGRA